MIESIQAPLNNQIVLTVVLPLLAAFLLPVIDRVSRLARRVTGPSILLLCLFCSIIIATESKLPFMVVIGGFLPPSGINFYIDQAAILFNALVLVMLLVLWPYNRPVSVRTDALLLLLGGASCGLAVSGDLFNIFVFYELVSVACFGLVASPVSDKDNGAAFVATVRYIIISSLGTILALSGIALVYTLTGTLNIAQLSVLAPEKLANTTGVTAFVFILLGFGVKAELFPVNTWVGEVYATAQKRISALLAGLVSKLAVLVLVRLLVLAFQTEQAMQIMLLLGVLGVLSGELAAWRSRDLSRMLAYSSIGQLGMIFIAFSIPGKEGVIAGFAVALHHLLIKPALFLLAECWDKSIDSLRGAAKASPVGAGLFTLFVLSLIGVPPLPGFWAKLLLVTALLTQSSPGTGLALGVILVATVIEVNYFLRVVITLYSGRVDGYSGLTDKRVYIKLKPDKSNLAVAIISGVVLIMIVVLTTPVGQQLNRMSAQFSDAQLYVSTVFPEQAIHGLVKNKNKPVSQVVVQKNDKYLSATTAFIQECH